MEVTQVKVVGDGVSIVWQTRVGRDGDAVVTHKLTGGEAPAPSFLNAISDLRPDVIDLMEIPEEWFGPASVVGINVQYDGGALEVSISFKRKMRSGRVVGIATPRVRSRKDHTEQGKAFMTEDMERRILDVIRQAEAYVNGRRAQTDIEETPGEEPEIAAESLPDEDAAA